MRWLRFSLVSLRRRETMSNSKARCLQVTIMDRLFINPGDVLFSKYRVDRVLGSGGMGIVVAVRTIDSNERFAIKVMHLEFGNDAGAQRRFFREARACMRLSGAHTARVHDVGRLDDGSLVMRMEYLEGVDLKEHLAARGQLSAREALDCVTQACRGLAEAHALGIVHRDVKPANLFLTRQPDGAALIKVLDFGILKQPTHEASLQLTGTGAMLGSPLYMSPEQMMQARDVDSRTDIWSIGVVLYELLIGSPPFNGETLTRLVHQVLNTTPKTPRSLEPQLPPELDAIVMRCLEKDPANRFATMADLIAALSFVQPSSDNIPNSWSASPDDLAHADTVVLTSSSRERKD